MSVGFTRTQTGIVNKWRFHAVPTIYVEGPTDISFFAPVVEDLDCRFEPFHGRENAKELIDGLISADLPYLVVLDGDYEILSKRRVPHRRVVRLQRYSFENYLWESAPVNLVCLRYAQSGDRNDVVGPEFDRLNRHLSNTLRDIVEFDVAARRSVPAPEVLPNRVEMLLVDSSRPYICPKKVGDLTKRALGKIGEQELNVARKEVAAYLSARRLADLLKGHVLFGILRRLFVRSASAVKGTKVSVTNEALTQLLAVATWNLPPSEDHRALRIKIRKNVRYLMRRFPTRNQSSSNAVLSNESIADDAKIDQFEDLI
jgi:hypothetical protein